MFVGAIVLTFVKIYNKSCEYFYDRKVKNLEEYEKNLLQQIDALNKKKI